MAGNVRDTPSQWLTPPPQLESDGTRVAGWESSDTEGGASAILATEIGDCTSLCLTGFGCGPERW